MKKLILIFGLAVMLAATAGTASATILADDGASKVDFAVSGTNLVVTLTNYGPAVDVPSNILTGVFFNMPGNVDLGEVSALLSGGSTVLNSATQPAGGVVGGEWAYKNNLGGNSSVQAFFPGTNEGISSSGLGVFGNATFPGVNLAGPNAVDGMQYGIISGIAGNANAAITSNPLVQNAVQFTLSGVSASFNVLNITHVGFQYGTALGEHKVPEPGTLLLLGSGLMGIALYRRRRA